MVYKLFAITLLITALCAPARADAPSPREADSRAAVILSYHHIGGEHDNAISPEQFSNHMSVLRSAHYNPQSLGTLVKALSNNQKQPLHSINLTFDVMNIAVFNALIQNNVPFTVFIAPRSLTKPQRKWIIKNHKNNLIAFGLTTAFQTPHDLETSRRALHSAITGFREIIGEQPRYFSYKAGLYTEAIKSLIIENGFDAAFGQHSGLTYGGNDMHALPRFTMTAQHGGLDRFEMIINALPLPSTGKTPNTSIINTATPSIGMTLPEELENAEKIDCFVSGQDKPRMRFPSEERLEIRLNTALQPYQRTRVNCITQAGKDEITGKMRWRWGGFLLEYRPH